MIERQTPRVILRRPRKGRFEDEDILVLEMGLGGAKFEHSSRLVVGRAGVLSCGPLTTQAVIRHSVLLPTPEGVIYQSGASFEELGEAENALLIDLLVHEAREQVVEWESNLAGEVPPMTSRGSRRSAVAPRFLRLRLVNSQWQRSVTADPNHPGEGITIAEDTPEEEIELLCETFKNSDQAGRELMRRMATLASLERMRE
jgi:hypothetical protein